MKPAWVFLFLAVGSLLTWTDSAHAQWRRRSVTTTPFGSMPSGMSMDQYAARLQQQQYMKMVQQQQKMEQDWLKQQQQLAKKEAASKKSGKDKDKDKKDDTAQAEEPPRPLTPAERRKKELEKIAQARANLGIDKAAKPAATAPPAANPGTAPASGPK